MRITLEFTASLLSRWVQAARQFRISNEQAPIASKYDGNCGGPGAFDRMTCNRYSKIYTHKTPENTGVK
ncbi:MAG: hypothetical protein RI910_1531 [Verrucomicrobiota bacterium]|jgi:hypothetical protein